MGTNTVLSPDQLHAVLSARIQGDSMADELEEAQGPLTPEDFID